MRELWSDRARESRFCEGVLHKGFRGKRVTCPDGRGLGREPAQGV